MKEKAWFSDATGNNIDLPKELLNRNEIIRNC